MRCGASGCEERELQQCPVCLEWHCFAHSKVHAEEFYSPIQAGADDEDDPDFNDTIDD